VRCVGGASESCDGVDEGATRPIGEATNQAMERDEGATKPGDARDIVRNHATRS
jgi:hypothetical protein